MGMAKRFFVLMYKSWAVRMHLFLACVAFLGFAYLLIDNL
jgi:hypothetical protein